MAIVVEETTYISHSTKVIREAKPASHLRKKYGEVEIVDHTKQPTESTPEEESK